MRKNGALLALLAVIALAWCSTVFRKTRSVRGHKAQTEAAHADIDLQWSSLERQVLFNLDSLSRLKDSPATASFLREVDSHPLLRKALQQGMDPEAAAVFKSLVARYAAQPEFLRAVQTTDKSPTPTKDGCSSAPTTPAKAPALLRMETSDGCSPSSALPIPNPAQ